MSWNFSIYFSVKPTLKKVSKYENKFAKLQKKAAEFNFRNQLKVVKKKEFTLEEEDKEVSYWQSFYSSCYWRIWFREILKSILMKSFQIYNSVSKHHFSSTQTNTTSPKFSLLYIFQLFWLKEKDSAYNLIIGNNYVLLTKTKSTIVHHHTHIHFYKTLVTHSNLLMTLFLQALKSEKADWQKK